MTRVIRDIVQISTAPKGRYPARGLVPNVIKYSTAIGACDKGQRPDHHCASGRYAARVLVLNVSTYSTAISACDKGQRLDHHCA